MGRLDVCPGALAGVIVDAHVHILPDSVRNDLPGMASRDRWFGTCHPPGCRTASVDSAIAAMDASGVDMAVMFTWPFASPELCRDGNDYIAKAVRRFPDRVIGFGAVQPASPEAAAEVERCARLGLRGIGELNADAQGWSLEDPGVDAVVAASVRHDLPWTLHCSEPVGHAYPGKGTSTPERVLRFAERHDDLRLICAHLGGGLPLLAHIPEVRVTCRRVWFDTAAVPYVYTPGVLRAVIDLCGAERLLLGTDHPLLDVDRYTEVLAGLTGAETAMVMGGSAAQFLSL